MLALLVGIFMADSTVHSAVHSAFGAIYSVGLNHVVGNQKYTHIID